MLKKVLEIACFNLESALIAQSAGADRIELCTDYSSGGISPKIELVKETREKIQIPLHVIVRSRDGNFCYNAFELEEMVAYTELCKNAGVNGVVFGALTDDKKIDLEACSTVKKAAGNMTLTFHRAIDECVDIKRGLQEIISLDYHRVLTSGGKQNAMNGIQSLKEMQNEFGNKIIIMPGGGIRSNNIKQILDTGCKEFHSAAITKSGALTDSQEIENLKLFL
ncbi:MAG: copper homeostasis protein CutC [Bacteroidia bacterium]|nr:copper homeostasis protein CutC [Bacteroidia bacterium]